MAKTRVFRWVKGLFLLSVLIVGAGYGRWRWTQTPANAPKFQTATVTSGGLVQVVTASGQLNPVIKVEVGSQISGIIQKLLADFNSPVKEGQLIAQIDPGTYEANFIQAEGNLASAKAALEYAKINEARAKTLRAEKLNAQAEYDKALVDLHQAEANVKINEGALRKAQVDLGRCKIYSPIDGIVISRNVDVGQTVAASLSAPTLFLIANDLSKMQIQANVAEADIGQLEVDQNVDFTVDALPGQTFHGKVTQIRNAPKTDQNVVTYETIIEVSNPNLKLKPGMTANVSVIVAHRDHVLKIPNAALRFRPPRSVQVVKAHAGKTADTNKPAVAATGDRTAEGEKKPDSTKKAEGAKSADSGKTKREKKKADHTVYVLRDGALQLVKLKLGITDGRDTELLEGLKEGDAVVVDMTEPKESTPMLSRLFTATKK
jgi:HlyD family secretion protein